MARKSEPQPQLLDGHGRAIEPGDVLVCVDAFAALLPNGVEVGALRGQHHDADSTAVRARPDKFKKLGAADPPPSFTLRQVWQPEPRPKPNPADYVISTRRVVGASVGTMVHIEPGEHVHKSNPVVSEYSGSFRELTATEIADLAAAIEAEA
jgi:hypothetical protein